MPLYEITNEIEKESGMKVNEIMELGGQSMYRRLEYNAIFDLSKKNKKLIIYDMRNIYSSNKKCRSFRRRNNHNNFVYIV